MQTLWKLPPDKNWNVKNVKDKNCKNLFSNEFLGQYQKKHLSSFFTYDQRIEKEYVKEKTKDKLFMKSPILLESDMLHMIVCFAFL